MDIKKLNQLYKPKRLLFYIEADKDDVDRFYNGEISDAIGKYTNAFGTYDHPGLFYIDSLDKEVIGIEYRVDDDRIKYPDNLKSIILDASIFYSIEIDKEITLGKQTIQSILDDLIKSDDAHRIHSDLSVKKDCHVIAAFSNNKRNIIHFEAAVDVDNTIHIINDDADSMEKASLYRQSFFDPITNHYNWNHLVAFLEMPMNYGIDDYAFVHFDIKEFKVINEVYGHIAANNVLINIVKAMNEADFVYASARCHNDNFAMMIKDMPEDEMISQLEGFFNKLSHLEVDDNYTIYYRCGVVPMQRSMLLGNRVADAGKMAQSLGTNSNKTDIIIYTDKMHDDILWSKYIKAYVDTAIDNDEFLVYLQPKFDIKQETIKGAEALIRWNYKNKEFLPPDRFIPFFEKDGSIGKVDDIVLNKVCAALDKWKKEGKPLYPISVNLSRNRMYDKNIVNHLTEIVDSYNVSHELIDFELTESATYEYKEHMLGILQDLRNRGFLISMDDFGTGYSSLSLLTEMPLDTLKIDKSFVDKIGLEKENDKDITVIKHIIILAKELNFMCLAEGAEIKTQIDELRTLGCDVIQGYYYSKPIPLDEYEKKYL
ncbi:MAG: GGDEF domain-containing phosphodiesterase [Lachnospiraceae bacterium]|nr:GGDEF domain-containing phosphodiesterase [Lachnospiraceae bacterium]